jgi:DNA-binding transcriptional LysR family regulator
MENELPRLRHILAVANAGSFTRAAEELRITQPALSRSIAAFETRYRIRLFDRGRGGTVPTSVGASVIAEAESLLRAVRTLEHNLELFGRGEAGRVAIGLGPLMASVFLPRLSQSMLQKRPKLQLRTEVKLVDQLLAELMDDRIEMIIANTGQLGDVPGISPTPLGTLELILAVRAGHGLADRGNLTFADLTPYPVASPVDLPAGRLSGDHGAFICDNFHILRETVLGTDCVWLTSPAFIADDLRDGRLIRLDITDSYPDRTEICVAHRRGRTLSPAALAVLDELKALMSVWQ